MSTEFQDIYELTPLQEAMLVQSLYTPESAVYNIPVELELCGELDPDAFEAAWRKLVARHDVLRTSLVWEDLERPYQVVHPAADLTIARHDWRNLPPDERDARVSAHVKAERERVFSLTEAPLVRASLIRVADDVHRFVLTAHHAVLEGWSIGNLMREAGRLYESILSGMEPALPPARPFVEYIRWLRERDRTAAEVYWRETLGGLAAPTRVPLDHPEVDLRALARTNDTRAVTLPRGFSDGLREWAREQRLTQNTVFQGLWALLLSRYTDFEDVVFGTAVSGRPADLPGADEIVGLFVNTLPVRVTVREADRLVPWLQSLQREQAAARQFEFAALRQVQAWGGTPGGQPIFDNVFVFQNWAGGFAQGEWAPGIVVHFRGAPGGSDQPLTLNVAPAREIGVSLAYNPNLFDGATVERMLAQYRRLLEDLVAGADRPLSSLSMLDDVERGRVLVEWNDTAASYPRDASIHALFEERATSTPDAIAVEFDGQTLTYDEVNRRANQVAHHLIGHGVGPEVKVGIAVERSVEMVVGILGVLKAGGAYVPLDPSYPPARLAFMMQDTKAPVVLAQAHLESMLPEHDGMLLRLDADWPRIGREPETNPAPATTARSLAYVMYTSGSTGRPKGVCVTHRSVIRLVRNTNYLTVGPDDVVLQFAPISFDASTLELWGSLLNGAKLVVFPPQTPSLEQLGQALETHGITTLWLTGALFQQMVNEQPDRLAGVRQLLAGGDALPVPHVRRMIDRLEGEQRLINGYGPTENTTFTCCHVMRPGSTFSRSVPIGRPVTNTTVYILDASGEPVPVGVPGELYTGGDGLARAYQNDPLLTAERFVPDPFGGEPGARLYRTGDRARFTADGTIEFLGRVDFQAKVRGFRIEPGEIETALLDADDVREAVVVARIDSSGEKQLVAYLVAARGQEVSRSVLRDRLAERLPVHMIPSAIVFLDAMPLSANGKVDRSALPEPSTQRQAEGAFVAPRGERESRIAAIWRDVLDLETVGVHDNFFDLGGHSLQLIRMHRRLEQELDVELPILELFRHTTISAIAGRVGGGVDAAPAFASIRRRAERRAERSTSPRTVAIVGMSGRFPGASGVDEFWANLRAGVEAIEPLTDEQMREAGVDPALLRRPDYVKAGTFLDGVDLFDAPFFGYTPRQAEVIDPQQRLFLECAWEAIESAGYDPEQFDGSIGVFAGVAKSSYLDVMTADPELRRAVGGLQLLMGSDKDYLPTRVSYKLGLNGPSINVQTACSTSLVSTHLAVQSLLNDECDMALAGGASIRLPQQAGYLYHQDGIASPDGHCRAFDAGANGTVGGNGVAIVLLKRLEDAVADGDRIIAVIRGSALNNDGADKIGYTAPSVDRQAEVVYAAQTLAGVDPRSITYVEAHGTGTALGDPIEIEALTRAFRAGTDETGFCAIGSVKTNVGHLDAAAGVTGLIKASLALRHQTIPPSLNFRSPNPKIDFASSPFYVSTEARPWTTGETPRRAGVSSFGIGGTNAHVIVEEAPAVEPSAPARPWQLLTLSARTADALERATDDLVTHLRSNLDVNLADVAFTLHAGRRDFAHRRAVAARDVEDAIATLAARDSKRVLDGVHEGSVAPVVFMFPGQGAQHPNMGRELYRQHDVFLAEVDRCCTHLEPRLGLDLRDLLFPDPGHEDAAAERLADTQLTQPALFVIEHALARQWMAWGLVPDAMVGHSIGEYVAACIAGVLSCEDALDVVAERGRLMSELPRGAMTAVPVAADELRPRLIDGVSVATVNGPSLTVVAGPLDRIDAFEAGLRSDGLEPRRLRTSHAFHSAMMDPILEPFTACVRAVTLSAPAIPYLSNMTGTWITAEEATDPSYYARHLRGTVRFGQCLEELFQQPERVLLEVGPGQTLSALARRHPARPRTQAIAPSMRRPSDDVADEAVLWEGIGRLWLAGAPPRWSDVHGAARRLRVPLPTYPFERQRYWIDTARAAPAVRAGRLADPADWFAVPAWKPAPLVAGAPDARGSRWLFFTDADGLGDQVADVLASCGAEVTRVTTGSTYDTPGAAWFVIDPGDPAHYRRVLESLDSEGGVPDRIVHMWSVDETGDNADRERTLTHGFYSILHLMQAFDGAGATEPLDLTVVTSGVHAVTGVETLRPLQATALGPCKVLTQEFPHVSARSIDVDGASGTPKLAAQLARDLYGRRDEPTVAYRGGRRWAQGFETIRVDLPAADQTPAKLRPHGVYVITGGLGGVGLELADWLAQTVQAKLVLVGRAGLPAEDSDDPVARRRAERVRALEERGAEVLVSRADVTDVAEMRMVLAVAEQRFGAVHGVIHAAGADDARTPLRTADRAACEHVLAPKLRGLAVLAEVLAGRDLDFCLVHSSLSSVMGAMEMSAYTAAHLFMDAFVHQQDRASATTWLTVNWETWRTWRTEGVTYPAGIAEFLMEPADFGDALARVLSLDGATQVLVSTGDVQARVDRWTRRRGPDDASRDRATEPAEHHPRPALPTDYVAPRNETEKRLAELWQAALGIERVGVYDNVLDLGADSVVVIQVGARAKDLGIELTPKQIFSHPTIAELAAVVRGAAAAASAGETSGEASLVPVSRDAPLSLSFTQQRLWFLEQLGVGSSYNIPQAFRLSGPIDVAAMERAFDEIIRRHEVLRTTFATVDGEPVQNVQPHTGTPLAAVDLRHLDAQERQAELDRRMREGADLPFDLARGPLLRATLLQLDDDEHVLLLVMHHIVTDGWSVGVLFRELGALYEAFRAGRPSPLSELEIQYADFAAWQNHWLEGPALDRQVAYWREKLTGAPVLDLPTDRPRAARAGLRGASLPFQLAPELSRALRTLSREQGTTLAMTLVGAFQVLLSRYTGQDDVVVGSPIAGRTRRELEDLIGCFVNNLVLRTDLSGDPPFTEALRRVQATSIDAYEHADLPFERLVDELDLPRDLSRNPLFQITFVLQNTMGEDLTLADLEVSRLPGEVVTSRFDLEVHVHESADGLAGVWLYDSDLFDRDTVERMSRHYQALVEHVVEDPAQRLSRIALLSADERRTLLVDWNDTAADLATDECLHELFQEQARQTPDADALVVGDRRLTFVDLDRRSNQLAHALCARGVGPDVPVALCTERTVEMVVGVLGILKAGGAYVPLDPTYPVDRLRFILEDVRAGLLLTQQSVAEDLPAADVRVVCLDADWPEIAKEPGTPLPPTAVRGNLGYIIYTSGSTGRPKGVAIAHASAVSLVRWAAPRFDERDRRGLLASTSQCFDLSVFELFLPLCCGGTVILAENALALPALPARDEVTLVNTVPSAITELLRLKALPSSVRTVCLAGEPLLPATVDALYDGGVEHVYDLYGPSEDTTYSTFARRERAGPATIGRPIANEQVYVLDTALEPVPIGIPGELYIGGAGLARGYFERPALTAERFVPDPFASAPGARLYRTGDLARYRADGNLEFLGRNDHQVKIRGFRIELGEIESALHKLDAVRDTVVTARPDHTGSPSLVAYVVPATDESALGEDEQIGQWEAVWEETYDRPPDHVDPTFDISGWNSSYTGQPIPAAEMRAWVDATVQRIGPVKARRVLEIGCGTGLLLYRVAPDAERYEGWDFAEEVLAAVGRHVDDVCLSSKVCLERRHADEVERLAPDSFDTVILNSVVQYFPSVEYLLRVLAGAVGAVRDGGVVYVGDVRSLPLLSALHASVLAHQAADSDPIETFRRRVQERVVQEEELALDPALFVALCEQWDRVTHVEVMPKRGAFENELSKFRYDVRLHVGAVPDGIVLDPPWSAWDHDDLDALRSTLAQTSLDTLAYHDVPNDRTAGAARAAEDTQVSTVGKLRARMRAADQDGVNPETLGRLGEQLGYGVHLSWARSGTDGRYDALLVRGGVGSLPVPRLRAKAWTRYANNPLQAKMTRQLAPRLRERLAQDLPEHMVPASYVMLDALPLTPNGKIDRAALPEPDWYRTQAQRVYVAPQTPTEERLAARWAEVLGLDRVGVEDNFFELGGHSLLATRLISRIRDVLGVEPSLRALFEHPTVAELAQHLDALTVRDAAPPIVRGPDGGDAPLSFSQQRLWFLDRLGAGAAYNMPQALRLSGALDHAALAGSLAAIVERHDALRTSFPAVRGVPVQRISSSLDMPLERVDLRNLPENEREREAVRLADAEVGTPFDLGAGPLIRAKLLRLADDDHVLLLTSHHIVFDGWSFDVLNRELERCYAALVAGGTPDLPDLAVQYPDYARWQREWLRDEVLEEQLAYWRGHLDGHVAPLELPADHPRPPVQTFGGAIELFTVPEAITGALRSIGRRHGVTMAITMLAAFKTLLHRHTRCDDVAVGSPIANRRRTEIENLVGFFVNTLVLRTDLSGDPTFTELLGRVKDMALSAYEHQDVPFEQLVDAVQPNRDLSQNPLFQILFAMQNAPGTPMTLAGVEVTPFSWKAITARFDLELHVWERADRLACHFIYNTDLFERSTIQRVVEHFLNLLEGIASDPDVRLADLPLAGAAERDRVVNAWNRTATSRPAGVCLHHLLEAQVDRTPTAPAVRDGDAVLTYRELDDRANGLAAALLERGVGPDARVAICAERSLDLVAGAVGILKAGGAYLPLDPAYPTDRLQYMIANGDVRLVLGHAATKARLQELLGGAVGASGEAPEIVWLDELTARPGTTERPAVPVAPSNLAYVLYTSGSTGRPKGVAMPHDPLVNLMQWQLEHAGVGAGAPTLQFAPLSFDVSCQELFATFASGGELCMVSEEIRRDPERLLRFLDDASVARTFLPFVALQQLAEVAIARDLVPGAMREVITAGEQLQVTPALAELFRRLPECRLVNQYGPTECHVVSSCPLEDDPDGWPALPPIGHPIANTRLYVLDERRRPVPVGVPGELYVGGTAVARGYLNEPLRTAERFVADPFVHDDGARLYRTGDLVRFRDDGNIEFLGRTDDQVKLRGFRVEPGEIEAVLAEHPDVQHAAVLVREDRPGRARLVAYTVAASASDGASSSAAFRSFLLDRLPGYMVPDAFVALEAMPLTPSGKVDRRALPAPTVEHDAADAFVAPRSDLEERIAAVWRELLDAERVGVQDNFFDIGGHSLLLVQLQARLQEQLGPDVAGTLSVTDLFQHPTIAALARRLAGEATTVSVAGTHRPRRARGAGAGAIAVIGMAGRFPGAPDIETFWRNLRDAVESVRFFTDDEMRELGVSEPVLHDPQFVKARAVLDDADCFDAWFFGYTPREAELIDPQQRVFLECAWEGLERAGYDPRRYAGMIGMWAGASMNTYLANLQSRPEVVEAAGGFQTLISNDKDFLATRVSYKLDLRGPSVNVQTACSTSLVAVHEACQALLEQRCDIALAGGVSVSAPLIGGHMYREGSILSPDGHCRTFDANARGTLVGNGVGVVVLKPLEQAVADGDRVHAVIRGTAVNNDGANKVGFTAPSVEGQAEVISLAQSAAGVEPDTVTYIEAHGTATPLGDPIEVAALRKVFEAQTDRKGFCGIGSLKTNMGHLDAAAGVAGLIKTVLALEHGELPPSLHFETPNPEIDFASSPFYVVTERRCWEREDGRPRRAGVSSFGIGGTNAHAIVEEAPSPAASGPSRDCQLLVLSAKSESALATATANLSTGLEPGANAEPVPALADIAYTLQVGRRELEHRCAVMCSTPDEAVASLRGERPGAVWTGHAPVGERRVAFMFPGQGAQYVNMGRGLYRTEAVFREAVDRCFEVLLREASLDLRALLYPDDDVDGDASERLTRTAVAQPALFTVQYALARLWQSWGVEPEACIGHSIGEFTAACVSGVLGVEDALRLVALRGQLIERLPEGAMLAVPVAEPRAREIIDGADDLWLSAVNAPSLCVVSGTHGAIDALSTRLAGQDLECRRLHTSHAFHSGLMDDAIAPFVEVAGNVQLAAARIPYASNVTGDWIGAADLADPAYWGRHIRERVRFSAGLEKLLAHPGRILLEVGPGGVLGALARQHASCGRERVVAATLRHPKDETSDEAFLTGALGRLWVGGASVDWPRYHAGARRRRVVLPTYPFARERFWIEPRRGGGRDGGQLVKSGEIGRWFYVPAWKPAAMAGAAADVTTQDRTWLVFESEAPLVAAVAERLEAGAAATVRVVSGDGFAQLGPAHYAVDPGEPRDYRRLLDALAAAERLPSDVVHGWSVRGPAVPAERDEIITNGLESVLFLVQALSAHDAPTRLTILTGGACEVTGSEPIRPASAAVLGLARVIPQEHPAIACRTIDVDGATDARMAERVADDLCAAATEPTVAYRAGRRWAQTYDALETTRDADADTAAVRDGGVYLITGGLGRVGLEMAEAIARVARVKLVLTGRSALPAPEAWDRWLDEHDEGDRVAQVIARLRAIESLGAEVLTEQADVADAAAMRDVLDRVDERFGALHGIVHAAGVVAGPSMDSIAALTRESCEAQLRPKLDGLVVLDELLAGRTLDFRMATSSLSTVLGGLGMAAYAAANACLDAYACHSLRGDAPWLSVDWDGWQLDDEPEPARSEAHAWGIAHLTIRPDEGRGAFLRLLRVQGVPQVAVSTGDLQVRLDRWVRQSGVEDDGPAGAAALELHARPQLSTGFVEPDTATERELADVWQTLLGIERIGLHDSFFDLGGHSLLATQLLNRLSRTYPAAPLSLRTLFDHPTIAGLASQIDAHAGAADADGAASLRERVLAAVPDDREALLRSYLVERLAEMLDVDADGLQDDTDLTDLGSESMIADLMWVLKRDLRLTIFAHELRERLSVRAISRFLAGELELVARLAREEPGDREPIIIEPPGRSHRRAPARKARNGEMQGAEAIFVLSSPRSGSTVFRLMLAGHSGLYVPPELSLLQYEGMQQWTEGRLALYARDTVVRTFAALLDEESVEAAGALLDDLTRRDAPVAEVYRMIQERAGLRTLVDKSPDYAMSRETLERAEALFERARYVHLVRHPYAVMESLVRNRMTMLDDTGRADPFGQAERGWAICNGNIVEFLEGVDAERSIQVRYEDLVRDPAGSLGALCSFLGLDFEPAMLDPYGKGRVFAGFGDPDILSHREIEPRLGEVWREIRLPRRLSEYARSLAESFAYELPDEAAPGGAVGGKPAVASRSSVDVGGLSSVEVDELLEKLLRERES